MKEGNGNNSDGQHGVEKRKRKREDRPNCAIYISNLPKDTTEKELVDIFSRYGMIAEDLQTGDKKVKLYRDDNENIKGDALVVYFKPESVQLAIQTMDDQELRFGDQDNGTIRVEEAQQQQKKDNSEAKKRTKLEKNQIQRGLKKLENKIAEWDDDASNVRRNEKVVVLKHMFTLKELEEDVTAELDIKEDIRDECETIGPVSSVILYNLEEDGIVTVKFLNAEDASACISKLNGRYFDGRTIEAWIMESTERYKKTKKRDEEEQEQDRLDKFGKWLEQEDES